MNTITPEMQIHIYASKLRLRIEKGEFNWNVPCAHYGVCTSKTTHYVVADNYFPTVADAESVGVEFGMRLCKRCIRRPEWANAQTLARRETVSLIKRNKCSTGNADCQRHTTKFILIGNDKRKYICVNHIAIHAMYRNVYGIKKDGTIVEVTEELKGFYTGHIRYSLIANA